MFIDMLGHPKFAEFDLTSLFTGKLTVIFDEKNECFCFSIASLIFNINNDNNKEPIYKILHGLQPGQGAVSDEICCFTCWSNF